jgi:cytochrome c biogenesis protein CcmG, thiol:disulfide interchange protein DsbE
MKKAFIPLALFAVLLVFLAIGLQRDPKELPSQFVNKPAPAFSAPVLGQPATTVFSPADMKGKVWLLNVFASWCVACQVEHPVLLKLAKSGVVPLLGLNYKDLPEDAQKWLDRHGNPYALIATDKDGRIGIDYGVYGVPETYLIDKEGIIRDKVIGPVSEDILSDRLLPLIKELSK